MIVIRAAVALLAAVLVLVGSSGCSTASAPTPGAQPASGAVPVQVVEPADAQAVVAALAEAIPTVQAGVVYTAANDPNRLLGRPNGYESKAAFADTRVPAVALQGLRSDAIEAGGSVEVFADAAGAAARKAYIQEIGKGLPSAVEYDYVSGGVLLRVSRELTPDQAAAYDAALTKIMG